MRTFEGGCVRRVVGSGGAESDAAGRHPAWRSMGVDGRSGRVFSRPPVANRWLVMATIQDARFGAFAIRRGQPGCAGYQLSHPSLEGSLWASTDAFSVRAAPGV